MLVDSELKAQEKFAFIYIGKQDNVPTTLTDETSYMLVIDNEEKPELYKYIFRELILKRKWNGVEEIKSCVLFKLSIDELLQFLMLIPYGTVEHEIDNIRKDVLDLPLMKDYREKAVLKDSGNRTEFGTGAVRDLGEGKGRFDLLPACALLRLAKHFEKGAKKYSERNWENGIPISSFVDSAFRHLVKYIDGQTDEDHLVAACWNVICAMWTEEKHPEMQNIPAIVARLEGIDHDN